MGTVNSGVLIGAAFLVPASASAHVALQTVALLSGAVQPWAMSDSAALFGASALWLAQAASSTDTRSYLFTSAALAAGAGAGLARPHAVPPSWMYMLAFGIALGRQSSKIVAVGTRVIGSWVAALCAMMFALCLRT